MKRSLVGLLLEPVRPEELEDFMTEETFEETINTCNNAVRGRNSSRVQRDCYPFASMLILFAVSGYILQVLRRSGFLLWVTKRRKE